MYQAIRSSVLRGVSQESLLWRTLKYWFRPASWVIGTTYRVTSRRFSEPPIVLGGAPRSGTTLLLSVLSAHPHIHAIPHETSAFAPPGRPAGAQSDKDFELYRVFAPLALSHPDDDCTRWCEKTPRNIGSFGAILDYFGSAVRLIHIVRDGRDATTSRHLRRPAEYYYDPSKWAQIVADGLRFRDHPQVLLIRYEDLVLDFVTTVEKLCAFLDEPPDTQMLDWFQNTTVRTHTAWEGAVQPIHDASIGRWKRPEHAEQARRFMQHPPAVALLEELGYETG